MKLDRIENRVNHLQIIRIKCCFEELVFQIHTHTHEFLSVGSGLNSLKISDLGTYLLYLLNFYLITFIKMSDFKTFHSRSSHQTV